MSHPVQSAVNYYNCTVYWSLETLVVAAIVVGVVVVVVVVW